MTTHETPDYLLARHKERFDFLDISDTVNRHAAELRRQGVEAIVVLAHSGAKHQRPHARAPPPARSWTRRAT